MKIWFNNVVDTERRLIEVTGNRIRIGRGDRNEVVLDSPFVAEEAAVLYQRGTDWELVALGINGVKLGDRQLYNGERALVQSNESISLFPFTLTLDLPNTEQRSRDSERKRFDEDVQSVINDVHLELLERMNGSSNSSQQVTINHQDDEQLLKLERMLDEIVRNHQRYRAGQKSGLVDHLAGLGVRDQMLASAIEVPSDASGVVPGPEERSWSKLVSSVPDRERELDSTVAYLEKLLKIDASTKEAERIDVVESRFWEQWETVAQQIHAEFRSYLSLRFVKKQVKDLVFGYGPLEDLLRLPSISEIMVVDRDHIYVERSGRLENTGRRFVSDEVIEAIIQRIVGKVSRRIDKSQPMVDARLADGSRVNAVIPPLAVSGPTITIRKFPYQKMLIDDLVTRGTLTRSLAEFLRAMVLDRRNVIVSGGTGSGKTTLLNCLSDFIPDGERVVTIEDTAELQMAKEHVVRMETKSANVEGKGEYTIRDLVRNALRMRPDRIVVGECRGAEALDMLQAMNTGHDGSLTTIHANSAREVFLRLEVLVQMAADLPVESIQQQIGSAVDIIIQLNRLRGGQRVVTQVTECVGFNQHKRELETRDLFLWKGDEEAEGGRIQATGRLPSFVGRLLSNDVLDWDAFIGDTTPGSDGGQS